MFENMHRLHPRGPASRGICVDADGAMLGPACVLVRQTAHGFQSIERVEAAVLQKRVLGPDRDEDWLFRQSQRIADALGKGEVALAQIYGLRIPVGELDDRLLQRLAKMSLGKAGYDPNEPRIPKGEPHAGEWTSEGGGAEGGDTAAADGGADDGGESEGGGNTDGASAPAIGTSDAAPTSSGNSTGGDGSAASTPPPIKFDWPSNTSASNPPPKAQDAAPSPSTLGSPDLGSDPSVAAQTDEGRSVESNGRADSQPGVGTPTPPEIPAEEPDTTQQVNVVLRAVATWLARALALYGSADPRVRLLFAAIEATAWLADYPPKILSYLDGPKTLEELQDAVANPRFGYEIHHIVEAQRRPDDPQRNSKRFPDRIDSRENLVRVPYWKHVEISSWYSTPNKELGGLTPREFLRGKNWEDQYQKGIEILRQFGVLK
jgi:hypothetical protein